MTDFVSRAAALEALQTPEACEILKHNTRSFLGLKALIDSLPAADVVPVRHGRWGKKQGGFWEFAACSLCGEKTPTVGIMPNYCPSCGARMTAPEARADG